MVLAHGCRRSRTVTRMTAAAVPTDRWTPLSAIPKWLLGAKILLALLLVVAALFPDVGGFGGKGMAFRLPIFLAPALVIPGLAVFRHGGRYSVELDIALTLPFLLDT